MLKGWMYLLANREKFNNELRVLKESEVEGGDYVGSVVCMQL
jgi:hypothetical protein